MKPFQMKTVFAILVAAMFCICVILAIEGKAKFLHMAAGYAVCFGVSFVVLYMRAALFVIAAAVVLILGSYLAIRWGWGSAGYGAIAGIATVAMMQFGWVGPHTKEGFQHDDYVKQQKAVYEQEKSGGGVENYAAQQKAQYEKEKARKEAEAGGPGGPAAPRA